jgi:hypothetical protein
MSRPSSSSRLKGTQDHIVAVPAPPKQVEHRQPVCVTDDRFAVDQAGLHRQLGDRCRGEGKAIGEVIASADVQGDTLAVSLREDAETVVLDS